MCSMVGATAELGFTVFELTELRSRQVGAALWLGVLHARLSQGGIRSQEEELLLWISSG